MIIEKALEKIAIEFEKNNIRWGLAASGLLSFYNIIGEPNDIDIIVSKLDVEEARKVLSSIGREKKLENHEIYSDSYSIFDVDGIEVDLISGFTINSENFTYKFYFSDQSISEHRPLLEANVPMMYLRDWYFMYILMGDPKNRRELMEEYFLRKNYREDEFSKYLEYDLTDDQKQKIINLMYNLRTKRRC